jgi:tetratricopeptide (TPR) repeat protein
MIPAGRDAEMHGYYCAAWKAFDEGHLDEALANLDSAISLADVPEVQSTYHAVYGGFLYRKGFYDRATLACTKAVNILHRNVMAWNYLGLSYLEMGEYKKAAFAFARSVTVRQDFNVYTLLAKCQLHFDAEAAVRSAESALSLSPDWDEARRTRDLALEKMKPANDRSGRRNRADGGEAAG